MDRNRPVAGFPLMIGGSLSARRAWIEIPAGCWRDARRAVALRKESVDRNPYLLWQFGRAFVALRKESVDRNKIRIASIDGIIDVALRKESVDRNLLCRLVAGSLITVALRKESVDRN